MSSVIRSTFRYVGLLSLGSGLALFVSACGERTDAASGVAAPSAVAHVFDDVAQAAGIDFTHHRPILDHKLDRIMPWVSSVGASVAAGDYDRDGFMDLYVSDSNLGQPNRLYHNNGDGTFTDVAQKAGVAFVNNQDGATMDALWGDVDNDGWEDLYVVRWGRNLLFHNNGNGTFTDVTARRFRRTDGKPGTDWKNGNAAVFLDYDHDGRLDLYVGNYFKDHDLWHLTTTKIMHDSFETARNAGTNELFHQEPDGSFREVGAKAGVADVGWTLAVGEGDLNNDGWTDLYSANDFGPDQMFLNRGDGTFENITQTAIGFDTRKGMNAEIADFNNDGWLDVYVTNITTAEYLQEGNMLLLNNGLDATGKPTFTDIALEAGVYDGGWGWGAKFLDYDNDGDLDLISGNGFISAGEGNFWYDLASFTVTGVDSSDAANWPPIGDRSFSGYEQVRFFVNDGQSAFAERATDVGLDTTRDERGVAYVDYDNDGDLDLYLANQHQKPELYRNSGTPGQHWLAVRLEGDPTRETSRDAIGARVTILAGGKPQMRERDGGNGFSGQSDPRLYFGLATATQVERVEIRWPDGGIQALTDVPADQLLAVRQDPSHYTGESAIHFGAAEKRTTSHEAAPQPKIDPKELDRQLGLMEQELEQKGLGFSQASRYRARAVDGSQHDRSIRFFERLVAKDPKDPAAHLQLACAYVDKIPTCGGLAAVVCKGRLARRSLDQLDVVLEADPDNWAARYCRGINHLHWPRALLHNDAAAEDLAYCTKLQARRGDAQPYYLRIYVALGDAYTKAGEVAKAREAWQQGLALFPTASELKERLAIADEDALLKFVEKHCSLEQPIDTDLSFLDRQTGVPVQ
ncbi:MAG: FG-GAP-like repeat-containing protein [Thermoanaerobaculia bacterium]